MEETTKKITVNTDEHSAPLTYFDKKAAIIHVTGDYENIGEITKVNLGAVDIFDYSSNEFINNMNISSLLPMPFKEGHIG